ncbi:MAG: hypothetical protein IKM70_06130 [Firmicutes bacterium]|nr:hypothetical protein [Bacillota bacterium]
MKKLLVMLLVVVLAFGLVACGEKESENEATYTLKVSLMDGSMSAMPVWVGIEEGIFEKHGIKLELSTFTNGMVQVEAIDTYDVGITGIGGILAGTLRYGGTIIDLTCSDEGTQYIYGRPESNVVASGKGHNTLNPEIYGSAEGWKGAEVLSVKGNVMEYMMLKVLSGVGLGLEDVNVTWMDQPTCNTSLIAGQGDLATINGPSAYTPDKEDFEVIATAQMMNIGLVAALISSDATLADAAKTEAIAAFMEAYYEAKAWLGEEANNAAAKQYVMDWYVYSGYSATEDGAAKHFDSETFYNVDQAYALMHDAGSREGMSIFESQHADILQFFIDAGTYDEASMAEFEKGIVDTSFVDALYAK